MKEVKMSFHANDMISYTENPKDFTKNLYNKSVKSVHNQNKISAAFPYTNNKPPEKETNPINNSIKNNEVFRNQFNQGEEIAVH